MQQSITKPPKTEKLCRELAQEIESNEFVSLEFTRNMSHGVSRI